MTTIERLAHNADLQLTERMDRISCTIWSVWRGGRYLGVLTQHKDGRTQYVGSRGTIAGEPLEVIKVIVAPVRV